MSHKVEMGKKYQTRNGLSARVICVDLQNEFYPVIALIKREDGSEFTSLHTAEGRYGHTGPPEEEKWDLVPVVERIEREFWLNVYSDQSMVPNLHTAKEEAEKWVGYGAIARVKITIVCEVGEGLTDGERKELGL